MTPEEKKKRLRLEQLVKTENRYPLPAYDMILEVVRLLIRHLAESGRQGQQLSLKGDFIAQGVRQLMLSRYGCMTMDVFNHWNIHSTSDFGRIVYNLISVGLLGADENDNISDFDDIYDFDEAFVQPFLPEKKVRRLPILAPLRKNP